MKLTYQQKKRDHFHDVRMNRKARKRLKLTYADMGNIGKVALLAQALRSILYLNDGQFPNWTRAEEKYIRRMSVRCGGC